MSLKMLLVRSSLVGALICSMAVATELKGDDDMPVTKEDFLLMKKAIVQLSKEQKALKEQFDEFNRSLSYSGVGTNLSIAKIKDQFVQGKTMVLVRATKNTILRNAAKKKAPSIATLSAGEKIFIQGFVDNGSDTYFKVINNVFVDAPTVELVKE